MPAALTLDVYCDEIGRADPPRADCARTIRAIAGAAVQLSELIALGPLHGDQGASVGTNSDGDVQKALDVAAHDIVSAALRRAPVAYVASEESDEIATLDAGAPLAVAIDPLDGSSNIDTNGAIGTIFSILPAQEGNGPLGPFGAPGHRQIAAGFVVYGPQTTLVLSVGNGEEIFTLDRRSGEFVRTRSGAVIVEGVAEYAINASNYRHWEAPVRVFVDDCLSGQEGPRGTNFNMRWNASLVAETFRILQRGGVFLYPADQRKGYEQGRLRLLYEAAPIAFIVEQAGGRATTGRGRILDAAATGLHQRVPLIFGCTGSVARLETLYAAPQLDADRSPLFAQRGLFRS